MHVAATPHCHILCVCKFSLFSSVEYEYRWNILSPIGFLSYGDRRKVLAVRQPRVTACSATPRSKSLFFFFPSAYTQGFQKNSYEDHCGKIEQLNVEEELGRQRSAGERNPTCITFSFPPTFYLSHTVEQS